MVSEGDEIMEDIVIIGGGIIGSAVARELTRYNANILVLEKEDDVCEGATKANSGIVHSGLDAKPGTLKAKYNVLGNKMYDQVEKELGILLTRNGSLNLLFDDNMQHLEDHKKQGETNGVEGLEIVDKKWLEEHEPNLQDNIKWALYAPSAGLIDSFEVNIAYAENATSKGAQFLFNTEIRNIKKIDGRYLLETNNGDIKTKVIINCAGVHSDEMNNMVSDHKITITPRKGEYYLLDNNERDLVNHTIFQQPSSAGKGVLVLPTVAHNILIGPNAHEVDKDDTSTTIM